MKRYALNDECQAPYSTGISLGVSDGQSHGASWLVLCPKAWDVDGESMKIL